MSGKKGLKIILTTTGVLLAAILLFFGIILYKGMGITIGRCLIADNGSYLLIDDDSPIVMSSDSEKMFSKLSSGDKILVVHSGVNESYPGSTGVYLCLKLTNGDIYEIPARVIMDLTELGWLGNTEETAPYQYDVVKYVDGDIRMSLSLLENWEYEIVSKDSEDGPYGIAFWPKDSNGGQMKLLYYPFFGVCGTGLETEIIFINDYQASKGTYDNGEYWTYISFSDYVTEYTVDEEKADWVADYVLLNDGADDWMDEYEKELEFILESILLGYHVETE